LEDGVCGETGEDEDAVLRTRDGRRPLASQRTSSLSTEENQALVRRLIDEVWKQDHLAIYTGAKYDQVSQKGAGWE